jgi:hypothetical protein
VTVYVVETVLGVASVLGLHPLRSLVGLALAVAVVVLVANDSTRKIQRSAGETAASPPRAEQ